MRAIPEEKKGIFLPHSYKETELLHGQGGMWKGWLYVLRPSHCFVSGSE
jgi:hypothetical protein